MKILLTLKNQPSNIGPEQLFDDQAHFDTWVEAIQSLLPNAKVNGKKFTFDGGEGTIEEKADNFTN